MKSFLAASIATLAFISTACADWVIEAKLESPQLSSSTVTKIKGDKMRVDIASGPMGAMSSIMDTATGESLNLMHAQKMAMKTNAEQTKQMVEMAKRLQGASTATAVKPKATGEKEKVGEYDCEIWTWEDGPNSAKFWVAAKHPGTEAIRELDKKIRNSPLGATQKGPSASDLPGAALKTEISSAGTKTTMTVTSVREVAVDAKDFEAPEGYQVMGMPGALPGHGAPGAAPGPIPGPKK